MKNSNDSYQDRQNAGKIMPEPLSHIMLIEGVVETCGGIELGTVNILFNANRISEKDARKAAESSEYSPYFLVLPQSQFEALFRDNPEKSLY